MNPALSRRSFLQATTTAAAGAALLSPASLRAANAANQKVVVGIMGLQRGKAHISGFLGVPNVEIAYVAEVDEKRLAEGVELVQKRQKAPVKGVRDFRQILEDKNVDVLSVAAPNFWHAPAAILGCQAGKHVYVEKPGSHNAREGELIVAAARKHKRVVQMGNQRRSYSKLAEAVQKLREGVIGKLTFARCNYVAGRPTIGRGRIVPPPVGLDYELWQGPVPERPFKDNLVHYNWHWMWHWGGGELANNGIHAIDIARWGLGVNYPLKSSFGGGRFHFQDDQETPDTGVALFDFGTCGIAWDGSSCHRRAGDNAAFIEFYGEGGTLTISTRNEYVIRDEKGGEIHKASAPAGDVPHFTNFVDAVRKGSHANLVSEIEEGQKSTLLCHLGNIAYRTGQTIEFDPRTKRIVNGTQDVTALWGRAYRRGWEPKV